MGPDACCVARCHNGAVGVWVDSRLGLLTDLGRLRHLLVVRVLFVAAGHIALCARSRLGLFTDLRRLRHLLVVHLLLVATGHIALCARSRLGLFADLGRLRHLLVVHFLLVAVDHIALCARSRRRALVGHTVRLWATWSSPRRHRHTMFKVPLVAPFHERIPLGSIESRTPVTLEGGDWLQAHVDV